MNSNHFFMLTMLTCLLLVGCESSAPGRVSESRQQSSALSADQMKALQQEIPQNTTIAPQQLLLIVYRHAPEQTALAMDYLDGIFRIDCHELCTITKKDI